MLAYRFVPILTLLAGCADTPTPVRTALCTSCTPGLKTGGDSTDFGGDRISCEGEIVGREEVTLEQATSMGFDVETQLAQVEITIEAPVRWISLEGPATDATVQISRTGTATLMRWKKKSDPTGLQHCHDGDYVVPHVDVEVSTGDGRLQGIARSDAGPTLFGDDRIDRGSGGLRLSLIGDASALAGDLPFDVDPAQTSRLVLTTYALLDHPNLEDRLELVLVLEYQDEGGWSGIDGYTAGPADGCGINFLPAVESNRAFVRTDDLDSCPEHNGTKCCQI